MSLLSISLYFFFPSSSIKSIVVFGTLCFVGSSLSKLSKNLNQHGRVKPVCMSTIKAAKSPWRSIVSLIVCLQNGDYCCSRRQGLRVQFDVRYETIGCVVYQMAVDLYRTWVGYGWRSMSNVLLNAMELTIRSKGSVPYRDKICYCCRWPVEHIYWFLASRDLGVKLLIRSCTDKSLVFNFLNENLFGVALISIYSQTYLRVVVSEQDFWLSWVVNGLVCEVSVRRTFLNDTNLFYISNVMCAITWKTQLKRRSSYFTAKRTSV